MTNKDTKQYTILSIVALALEIVPTFIDYSIFSWELYSIISFLKTALPIIGFIIAVYVFSKGKDTTGKISRILALIGIIIPIIVICFILFFVIGLSTGLISLM